MDTGLFVMKAMLLSMFYLLLMLSIVILAGIAVTGIVIAIFRKIYKSLFMSSLIAYLHLYRSGFSISRHEYSDDYHMHRFFWHGKMIQECPDISMVGDKWVTLNDGHTESLIANDPKEGWAYWNELMRKALTGK